MCTYRVSYCLTCCFCFVFINWLRSKITASIPMPRTVCLRTCDATDLCFAIASAYRLSTWASADVDGDVVGGKARTTIALSRYLLFMHTIILSLSITLRILHLLALAISLTYTLTCSLQALLQYRLSSLECPYLAIDFSWAYTRFCWKSNAFNETNFGLLIAMHILEYT